MIRALLRAIRRGRCTSTPGRCQLPAGHTRPHYRVLSTPTEHRTIEWD